MIEKVAFWVSLTIESDVKQLSRYQIRSTMVRNIPSHNYYRKAGIIMTFCH